MKLTLRSARKLENKIANQIPEPSDFGIEISPYDKNSINDTINNAFTQSRIDVETATKLMTIRSVLRRQIQSLNEESGINELISNRKLTIDVMNFYRSLLAVASSWTEPNVDIVDGKLEAIREGKVSSYVRDNIHVSALSAEHVKEIEGLIKSLEKRIEQYDDNILETNMGTKVELNEQDVQFLQSQGLL